MMQTSKLVCYTWLLSLIKWVFIFKSFSCFTRVWFFSNMAFCLRVFSGILMGLFLWIIQPKPLKHLNSQVCQICGDTVGLTATGDVFVACNECAFPVCRPCYEYERKDGNQSCPQCKTRYKRHRG